MKFFIKDFHQVTADLVTFTEEILNGKLHFLCSTCLDKSEDYVKIDDFSGNDNHGRLNKA